MPQQQFAPISARRVALEIVFLVGAVFVALAVDEAWEDYENGQRAQEALARIYAELAENHDLIETQHERHGAELARVSPVIELLDEGGEPPEGFDRNVTVHVSILRDTAWRTAQLADVLRYLPPEEVQAVAGFYALQDVYRTQMLGVFDYQGNVAFITAEPDVQLLSTVQSLQKAYGIEQSLLDAYIQVEAARSTGLAEGP